MDRAGSRRCSFDCPVHSGSFRTGGGRDHPNAGVSAFFATIQDNNRKVVENPLISRDGHYEIDFVDLEQKLADPQNKLLLFCSPHNPVGRVWTREELSKVYALCQKYKVDVLSDEIHADLVFKRHRHTVFAPWVNRSARRA